LVSSVQSFSQGSETEKRGKGGSRELVNPARGLAENGRKGKGWEKAEGGKIMVNLLAETNQSKGFGCKKKLGELRPHLTLGTAGIFGENSPTASTQRVQKNGKREGTRKKELSNKLRRKGSAKLGTQTLRGFRGREGSGGFEQGSKKGLVKKVVRKRRHRHT